MGRGGAFMCDGFLVVGRGGAMGIHFPATLSLRYIPISTSSLGGKLPRNQHLFQHHPLRNTAGKVAKMATSNIEVQRLCEFEYS